MPLRCHPQPQPSARSSSTTSKPRGTNIDAAARPVIDPHLRHSLAHRFHVAGIAEREAPDARHDPGTRIAIPPAVERGDKSQRLPDFDPTELSRRRDNEAWRCNHRAARFVRFGRMDPAALRQVPRCWADDRLACRCAVYLACRRTDMHKGMDRLTMLAHERFILVKECMSITDAGQQRIHAVAAVYRAGETKCMMGAFVERRRGNPGGKP